MLDILRLIIGHRRYNLYRDRFRAISSIGFRFWFHLYDEVYTELFQIYFDLVWKLKGGTWIEPGIKRRFKWKKRGNWEMKRKKSFFGKRKINLSFIPDKMSEAESTRFRKEIQKIIGTPPDQISEKPIDDIYS